MLLPALPSFASIEIVSMSSNTSSKDVKSTVPLTDRTSPRLLSGSRLKSRFDPPVIELTPAAYDKDVVPDSSNQSVGAATANQYVVAGIAVDRLRG